MRLTEREQQLLDLIRQSPLSTPEELARKLGSSRAAVNVHVSNLIKKGVLLGRGYVVSSESQRPGVVVVGGANMDFKARTHLAAVMGTSNPGHTAQAAGGVARNVAENLARLEVPVALITALGQDALGEMLLRETEAAGVSMRGILRVPDVATSTYTAVLNQQGELVVAVAAMDIMERLTPAVLTERRHLLANAAWVVVDGNLPEATLLQVLMLTAETHTRTIFEPVSVPKAAHLLVALEAGLAPYAVTPNIAELSALVGWAVPDTVPAIQDAAQQLQQRGISLVWVRRGGAGSVLCTPQHTHELPALPAQVVDVTGAGDSMLAAFIAALLDGEEPAAAAQLAHAAAALTIEQPQTVVPDLTLERLRNKVKGQKAEGKRQKAEKKG